MADGIDHRDFFISFNSADLDHAEAIDAALRAEGFSTFFHPRDLPPGGNIPMWMDDALMNSVQTLALYSPDYMKDKAVYSKAERYASWWADPEGKQRKLVPVLLRDTTFTPLMAMISRIEVTGLTPKDAAARIIKRLKTSDESQERDNSRNGMALPKVFHAAYRSNPNFTGRFEALDALQKSLRMGTTAAVTAVAGMGGVGKTTLAAEYCHRFGSRYGGVWWVRAEQEPVMLADLVALGPRLGIAATGNVEADVRATLENLAARNEPWLMVYDNAPDAAAVQSWLPFGAVRCLITSRFAGFDGIAKVTKLDQWSDQVTADYLLARTGRDDQAGALRLAHVLGGLPLAAEQAAVDLRPRAGTSFDNYPTEIVDLIKRPRPAGAAGDYPDTVYAAFVKSLETLRDTAGGETALNVLRLCSFLSPDGVQLELIIADGSDQVLPVAFIAIMANKSAREDSLAALVSLSLLRQENTTSGSLLVFHRLLLEVVRDWMGADARALWGDAAVQLVGSAFPFNADDDPSQWPICAALMPHVSPLEATAPRTGIAGKALDFLLNQASLFLAARGDRVGALALAEKSLALKRTTRVDEPLEIAAGLHSLASRYLDLDTSKLNEAEAAFREALAIEEAALSPTDPNLAVSLSNLGALFLLRHAFAEAESLALRSLKIVEDAGATQSASYGRRLFNLGVLYGTWASEPGQAIRFAQGQEYITRALTVLRAIRGVRHPDTADCHAGLAHMHMREGNWLGAAGAAELAVAIMLSLDLSRHPEAGVRATLLAEAWRRSGHAHKAARLPLGDISDILPVITQIEREHRAWVAEDPKNRHFGPPPPPYYEAPKFS